MKELQKIRLEKAIEILSENEMMHVTGGVEPESGSGSGNTSCLISGTYKCNKNAPCKVNSHDGTCHYHDDLGADNGCYCDVIPE